MVCKAAHGDLEDSFILTLICLEGAGGAGGGGGGSK